MSLGAKSVAASDCFVSFNRTLGGSITNKSISLRAPNINDVDHLWTMVFNDFRIMQSYPGEIEKTPDPTKKRVEETAEKIRTGNPWHSMVAVDRFGCIVGYLELEPSSFDVHFKIAVIHPEQGNKLGSKIASMMTLYAAAINTVVKPACQFLVGVLVHPISKAARTLFSKPPFITNEQEELKQTVVKIAIGVIT